MTGVVVALVDVVIVVIIMEFFDKSEMVFGGKFMSSEFDMVALEFA